MVQPTEQEPENAPDPGRRHAPGLVMRHGGVVPSLAIAILSLPVFAGLAGTLLPAFGYLPSLGGTGFTTEPFRALLLQPALWTSILISFGTGLAATAIALLVVLLVLSGFVGTKIFSRIQHLLSPLLAVPHAAAAFGLAFLIAPSGLLLRLISPELTGFAQPPDWLIPQDPYGLAMTAGLIAKEMPFLFLVALAALPQLPVRQSGQMMAGLGYGRICGFIISVWPGLYRQIRLPVLATIAYSTSVVDVALILGPSLPAPLAVRITQWMADADLSMRFLASAGALLQLATTLAAMAFWLLLERLGRWFRFWLSDHGFRLRRDRFLRLCGAALALISSAIVFVGIATLALWSVAGLWPFPDAMPETIGLKTWMRALPQMSGPLGTTITLAAASSGLALVLTVLLLHRHPARESRPTLHGVLYLPLLVPQLSFVFGLQILALFAGFEASFPLLLVVHLVFVLPYVMLSLTPPWSAFDRRFELIAAGLQKTPLDILLRVRLPMLMRACLTAFAIGFAVSIGLYLPTLLVGAGRIVTITTEAVALSSGGDRRVIGVYALMQTILPLCGFLVASVVPQLLFRRRRAMRI